jgi:site-specific DNA recombinase
MGSRFPCIPKLNNMEADRVALTEKLRLIASEGNVIKLHPAAIGRFASSIEALHAPLSQSGDPARVASYRAAFRKSVRELASSS